MLHQRLGLQRGGPRKSLSLIRGNKREQEKERTEAAHPSSLVLYSTTRQTAAMHYRNEIAATLEFFRLKHCGPVAYSSSRASIRATEGTKAWQLKILPRASENRS